MYVCTSAKKTHINFTFILSYFFLELGPPGQLLGVWIRPGQAMSAGEVGLGRVGSVGSGRVGQGRAGWTHGGQGSGQAGRAGLRTGRAGLSTGLRAGQDRTQDSCAAPAGDQPPLAMSFGDPPDAPDQAEWSPASSRPIEGVITESRGPHTGLRSEGEDRD